MGFSHNEKVAKKIVKLIYDYDNDPEQIGYYIARISPDRALTNLQVIANSAIMESNEHYLETSHDKLF